MDSTDSLRLELPARNLASLEFFSANADSNASNVEHWLSSLSATDHFKNGERLVQALDNLVRLDSDPDELYKLVEMLRTPALSTTTTLYQRHLKRNIFLDDKQQARFNICHLLHRGLATAYQAVVQCYIDKNNTGERLATALHRAMSDSALTYLFQCLLYRPATSGLWLQLHKLYQIAKQHNFLQTQQADPFDSQSKIMSTENHYKRALLLSRTDTNKLSNQQIQKVWQILSLWSGHGKIDPKSGLSIYYAANLMQDDGLQYALPKPDQQQEGVIGLDVRVLTAHLQKLKTENKATEAMPADLIDHLLLSWGHIQKRSSPRQKSFEQCEVCIGFTGLHYFLSGKRHFDDIVAVYSKNTGKSNFEDDNKDVWSSAHDTDLTEDERVGNIVSDKVVDFQANSGADGKQQTSMKVEISNTSNKGFCLKIKNKLPQQIHPSELIGIRQTSGTPWTLYDVRWLGVFNDNELTLGTGLLTSAVEAGAISLTQKAQDTTHFQRCLILPDPNELSLIMPNLAAKEGLKFDLIHNNLLKKGKLVKCIASHGIWNQYQIQLFG
ncbi:hypothetical protein [uncultured Endozoicomonas sp.]|uniref:hypothetical protein n=1 Tax=uncultured Endozoicomonas sp. TaxID=432652 RepID=UPI002627E208|nr:hypothetical protein [uncultured Endozoicomonas sp.]